MNRTPPAVRRRRSALFALVLAALCLATAAPRAGAEPPAPEGAVEAGDLAAAASPTLAPLYRLQILDRITNAPIARCRVYREGPGNERRPMGETDANGRLGLPDPGQSGQRLLALSLSYDAVNVACPLQGETILRARLTRYAAQNEEKSEIAAAAGDFATASELLLEAARQARREAAGIGRDPASERTPNPAGTPGQGDNTRRFYRLRPQEAPPMPRATPGDDQAAQRYERQAYEYAARSLRLQGPATVRRSGTGAVEPSPEMRRQLEILQRRQNLPTTGRLEPGVLTPSRRSE